MQTCQPLLYDDEKPRARQLAVAVVAVPWDSEGIGKGFRRLVFRLLGLKNRGCRNIERLCAALQATGAFSIASCLPASNAPAILRAGDRGNMVISMVVGWGAFETPAQFVAVENPAGALARATLSPESFLCGTRADVDEAGKLVVDRLRGMVHESVCPAAKELYERYAAAAKDFVRCWARAVRDLQRARARPRPRRHAAVRAATQLDATNPRWGLAVKGGVCGVLDKEQNLLLVPKESVRVYNGFDTLEVSAATSIDRLEPARARHGDAPSPRTETFR